MTKLEFVAENGNIRIDKYIADNEPSLTNLLSRAKFL